MKLETRIAGIPCLVELEYQPPLSGSFDQPAEAEGFTIEKVMDRRGRKADWLEAKMTDNDVEAIVNQAFAQLRGKEEDDAYENWKADNHSEY